MVHKYEDIFYLVTATMVMINMMVEERIGNDEKESHGFYFVNFERDLNHLHENNITENSDSTENEATVGNFVTTCMSKSILK